MQCMNTTHIPWTIKHPCQLAYAIAKMYKYVLCVLLTKMKVIMNLTSYYLSKILLVFKILYILIFNDFSCTT